MTFPYEPGKAPNEPGAIPNEQRMPRGEPSQLASAGDLPGGTDRASAIDLGGVDLGGVDLGGVDLSRVWTAVAAEVWRRPASRAERAATWLLRSPGLARALVTTPSLLLPWLISTIVVFGVGALVRLGPGQPAVWLVAPAIAGVGIAFAYGPGIDPAWELSSSCAVSDGLVLLTRAVTVFALNAMLGVLASAASGAVAALTFGWLIPMTAVTALALAVAVAARSAFAGASAAVAAWVIIVLASGAVGGQLADSVLNTATYLPYLGITVCCAVIAAYSLRHQRGFQ
jgi:hypothetical protein